MRATALLNQQAVDFARPDSGFTTDSEDLAVWLATKTEKSTVSVFCRTTWPTVGASRPTPPNDSGGVSSHETDAVTTLPREDRPPCGTAARAERATPNLQ